MTSPPLIFRLASDRRGVIAVIFALAAVPMILAAGFAVDLGQAYFVRSDLSRALDAATLAVAASSDTATATLNARLAKTFAANYSHSAVAAATGPTMVINNNIVTATVSAVVPMSLMAMLVPSITLTVTSVVNKNTSGVELVLALDTTGSMADHNKMTELKAAAHEMVATIFNGQSSATAAFVGIVPFTDTVNIGSANTGFVSPAPSTYDWGKDSHGNALGWGGCIEAPASPYDQEDAFAITGGKWAPYYWPSGSSNLWKTTRYGRTSYTITSSQGPNVGCVSTPITPLTNQRAPLDAAIDALSPSGSTHINVGMAWAWYTISPGAPFTQASPYDSTLFKKYVVLMTDGDNTFQTFGAYGTLSDGRLGTTSQSTAVARLNSRLQAVCDNMKAQGITIFTVALEVSSQTSRDLLSYCATPPGRYFEAQSSDLAAVFSSIGGQISKVRIAQ
ncbi:MAG: TadE/TadG family type IV pilus assembly protein [Rhodospirillaceae bacterium]